MNSILAIARVVLLEMIRRKDAYVLLILTALVTLALGTVNIFDDGSVVRYLKEACLTLIWISMTVIAVLSAARQIPTEKESRTLFPLLAKPVTRSQVLLGKFLGCWLACGLALTCLYTLLAVLSGAREHAWPLTSYFQAAWLHWMFCAVVVALTLLGSLLFAAVSSNATIVILTAAGMLLLGRHLRKVAAQSGGLTGRALEGFYFILPHLEFFDIRDLLTHNWPPLAWPTVAFDTAYAAAYGALFLVLACLVFRRKSIV